MAIVFSAGAAVAAEGDDKRATSKEYVDSGFVKKANKSDVVGADGIAINTGSTTKIASVKAVEDAITAAFDGKVDKTIAGIDNKIVQDITLNYNSTTGKLDLEKNLLSLEDGKTQKVTSYYDIPTMEALNDGLDAKQDALSCPDGKLMVFDSLQTKGYSCMDLVADEYKGE
jgi:hypothetical protein